MEKEIGGQTIKAEENENILAIVLYMLDRVIDEQNSSETKLKTIHPVYYTLLEKLDEINEIMISRITPIFDKIY